MTRENVIDLSSALNNKGIKVKYLSGAQYVKLLGIKRSMSKYIEELTNDEINLFESYGLTVVNGSIDINDFTKKMADKSFVEKLKAIRSRDFEPKELNFIEFDDFKKITDDVEFGDASILATYLLKEL